MTAMIEYTVAVHPEPTPTDDLATSAWDLLRHYARRRRSEPEVLAALEQNSGGLAALAARGLVSRCAEAGDPYAALLRAQPELWWIDLEMGVRAVEALAELLPADTLERLRKDALALVSRLDHGPRPAAWETGPDLFSSLIGDVPDDDDAAIGERERVLARGVGLTIAMSPEWLAPALSFIEAGPSRRLLRALVRDDCVLEQERWLSTLLLRGGARSVAIASAGLYFASEPTVVMLRDLLAVAPPTAMIRVAEAHGLMTLAGEGALYTAEALRTAFLTQAWQGTDLGGLHWWRAFRGEQVVARSLPELGESADALARDVATGLAHHVGNPDAIGDPGRREAIATCFAWVMERTPDYCAPARIAEAELRDIGRHRGAQVMAAALRSYAAVMISTARLLNRRPRGRDAARSVYLRVLRLRKAHPEMLPRSVFPDSLEEALAVGAADRTASRWLGAGTPARSEPPADRSPRASIEDPIPAADDIIATAEGLRPLPGPTAAWFDVREWSPTRLLGWMLPLPVRHLLTVMCGWMGLTPRARFVLADGGGAVVVTRRLFGVTVSTDRRAIPGGVLTPLPPHNTRVDRMVGWWAALLLTCGTIGTWLVLRGALHEPTTTLFGTGLVLFGLIGYLGALSLRRVLGAGSAVAVRDDRGRVGVWQVDGATRVMLRELFAPPAP